MGERKGQNKYYPPDFDPNKHFSLNSYHGVHALRERGKKANEGILIIRFEMPFNCWCTHCDTSIGMGVRYNSEKTKVGYFYSTPLFQFKMKCHICKGEIIIQTDPENFQYNIISGLRRREQRYTAEDADLPPGLTGEDKRRLATDPMFHLEHVVNDEEQSATKNPEIRELFYQSQSREDDFELNQIARKKFRLERKRKLAEQEDILKLSKSLSLEGSDLVLLPKDKSDIENANKLLRNSKIDVRTKVVEFRKIRAENKIKSLVTRRKSHPFSRLNKQKNILIDIKKHKSESNLERSLVSNEYDSNSEDNLQ